MSLARCPVYLVDLNLSAMRYILFIAALLVPSLLIVYPFLPGDYDEVASPVSMVIQLWSVFGLFVCIPALFWLLRTRTASMQITTADDRFARYAKATIWTGTVAAMPVVLFTFLGISRVLGFVLAISVVLLMRFLLRYVKKSSLSDLSVVSIPAAILCVQLWLFCFPFLLHEPLTRWSRHSAIANSRQLLEDIEDYHHRHGVYPASLNGTWKDYYPNVSGVEKYHYTFDDTTYHLYFHQPGFFLDRIGTEEYVVYNPQGKHMILSHSSWHFHFTSQQKMNNQGWYSAHETPFENWKYFWFD